MNKKTWKEFYDSGLLWWVNRSLHLFGWAIVVEVDKESNVIQAYPARVKFRGFDEKTESEGFIKLSEHIKTNADKLLEEAKE